MIYDIRTVQFQQSTDYRENYCQSNNWRHLTEMILDSFCIVNICVNILDMRSDIPEE